jgi:hypothetical protein
MAAAVAVRKGDFTTRGASPVYPTNHTNSFIEEIEDGIYFEPLALRCAGDCVGCGLSADESQEER